MPSIELMFLCEQVADIAGMLSDGLSLTEALLNKHAAVPDSTVYRIYGEFKHVNLSDIELINLVYDRCLVENA